LLLYFYPLSLHDALPILDVAAGYDFVVFEELQLAEQVLAASSGADGAEANAIVGAENSAVRRGCDERGAHKLAAMRIDVSMNSLDRKSTRLNSSHQIISY